MTAVSALLDELKNIYEASGIRQDLSQAADQLTRAMLSSYGLMPGQGPPINPAYLVLGVSPDDTDKLIRDVYRIKAKHYHPDSIATGNRERFDELQSAYELIKKERGLK